MLNDQLLAACLRTSYHVYIPSGATLTMRIGAGCPTLDTLLGKYHAQSFGYLTADNPRSMSLGATENRGRYTRLLADIQRIGQPYLLGIATSDEQLWEPERCLFVFDLAVAQLRALCVKYEQDVAVVGERGTAPRLLFLAEKMNDA